MGKSRKTFLQYRFFSLAGVVRLCRVGRNSVSRHNIRHPRVQEFQH